MPIDIPIKVFRPQCGFCGMKYLITYYCGHGEGWEVEEYESKIEAIKAYREALKDWSDVKISKVLTDKKLKGVNK